MQTVKARIISLIEQGKSNREIVETLGCGVSYPSLCRQYLGVNPGYQAPVRNAILAYMEADPEASTVVIARALGTRPETVSRAKAWKRRQERARCAG